MLIEIIPCLQDNYSYLIIDDANNSACVIDPSESQPIINFLEKKIIKLKYILNTHHHYDHVGGNKELKKKYGSVVVGFKGDSERIPGIDILLEDNQIWKAENFEAKIMHIPGHTSGHICFHFFKEKLVFTGDTLLINGTGRTDFQSGSPLDAYDSLFNKLLKLPEKTLVYPAHDYNGKKYSTIENEKNNNPRLKVNSKEVYADIMTNLNLANPKMMDVAVPANVKGLTLDQI